MVCKLRGKTQFTQRPGWFTQNSMKTRFHQTSKLQNSVIATGTYSQTRKLDETMVFYAVT